MDWKEVLRYPAAIVGVLLIGYWWQTGRLNLRHLEANPFINLYFVFGIVLLAVGIFLIATVSRENT